MKTNRHITSTNTPNTKGVRLHWQSLKEVKPVKLSSNMTNGKFVCEKELRNRNNNSDFLNILVP
jgi:hypothetical protein